ncbi:MAG: hypothetical protein JJE39_16685 [Vicinamibacteria bacterium]|nr:hypothetical protein [Vicinamibacteria bacterium]
MRRVLPILILASSVAAQSPPDFSGKWTVLVMRRAPGAAMGSAPPTLSETGSMGSGWGSELTLTQDADALTVEYTYFHPREIQPPFSFKYLLNGAVSRNTVNMGRGPQEQVSTAAWAGASLVITTTHSFINAENSQPMASETKQALSLKSPTLLEIETTRSGVMGGKASTTKTFYQKN